MNNKCVLAQLDRAPRSAEELKFFQANTCRLMAAKSNINIRSNYYDNTCIHV